ncbi:interleukin-1 receptor-associated kinase 4 isoform X2 [Gadus macrocephalus]|uniref:interleukin-1 receptor-associated kinase 4 isoform X1 n=1 Tax=Gadus macrocephalus TaxID=80720 RepID=UPI0028CB9132|nr:interleukin-1 receptor-associated kinase 4 isoform X1 [Gadus macrocephalus]XP_059916397.1 interleukin-1 receptor-associated kinase 4 isoform X2 [Gadus macrocephalus]
MNKQITSSTYIRKLNFSILRKLSDFLDPDDRWKEVIVLIMKPSGEPRYTQIEVRRFASLAKQGESPTIDFLTNWGTTNATVGELVDILKSNKLLAAAALLLPEPVSEVLPQAENDSNTPTIEFEPQSWPLPVCPNPHPEKPAETAEPDSTGYLSFLYHELMDITGNFDDRPTSEGGNWLGEGGFGTVYKGFVNNLPVAVKKLSPEEDILADELRLQFRQEIETLKTLKHPNLVDMVGFSCDGQYPCLVYVLMANGSVLDRLACMEESPPLPWSMRCLIATGSARGLDYLHNNHHVHRDIKSGNILLDDHFVAKISDFGLTRASPTRSSVTMQTERIVGTRAYMAPEALRGEITPKSDVFSFGVVLLEIISGLPPVDENREMPCLMELRYEIEDEDEDLTLEGFVDKKMRDAGMAQVERTYTLACQCLEDRKVKRPTIKQVLAELEDVSRGFSAAASGTGS